MDGLDDATEPTSFRLRFDRHAPTRTAFGTFVCIHPCVERGVALSSHCRRRRFIHFHFIPFISFHFTSFIVGKSTVVHVGWIDR